MQSELMGKSDNQELWTAAHMCFLDINLFFSFPYIEYIYF